MAHTGAGARHLRTLFDHGSAVGLTDGELLSRFVLGGGESAELAFAALVERHGPMVLRVCRSILDDQHDAEDALQATFLVLVRRAGSVRQRDSLASWLFGVALRVANCARTSMRRRRGHERRAAALAPADLRCGPAEPDLALVLHDELGRLAERFRVVLALCYLEGLTCEQAAERLGWPLGTVKSRLARGRERLKTRLTRRGLAPATGVIIGLLGTEVSAATIPAMVVRSTARMAVLVAAGQRSGLKLVPASVAVLTRKMLMLLFVRRLLLAIGCLVTAAALTFGMAALAQAPQAKPRQIRAQRAAAGTLPKKGGDTKSLAPEPVIELALRAADQITVPWMKAQALADIAAAQARTGHVEQSRMTFQRAAEMIEALQGNALIMCASLSWLAKAEATGGDRDGARRTVAKLCESGPKSMDASRWRIGGQIAAERQADAGDFEGAFKLLDALKDAPAGTRAFVLAEIAGHQAKAGDLRGARATMARADAEAERSDKEPPEQEPATRARVEDARRLARIRGLAPLVAAEGKAGELDAGRATLRKARAIAAQIDEERRPTPLAEIAIAQRSLGDRKEADATLNLALKIAENLPSTASKLEQLARVAIVQADAGDRKAGRETLERALKSMSAKPAPGSLAHQVVAAALGRVGDWEAGREWAHEQGDEIVRANLIEHLAFHQAKSGDAKSALEWAQAEETALLRAHALLGVVRGMMPE
jgi:RNA polymerase sigma factor (sigma-70 family)